MSDLEISSSTDPQGELNIKKATEEEAPTSSESEVKLAGTIEIDDDNSTEGAAEARATKRRHSGEENGSGEDHKRLATENATLPNDSNKDSIVLDNSDPKIVVDDSAGKEDEKKPEESKKSAPEAVIEISDDSSDSDICAVDSYQASAAELKRIRGDEYSSSSDYSSDSSSCSEDESVVLPRVARSAISSRRAQLYARAPRTDVPILNKAIISPDCTDKLGAHWAQDKDVTDDNVTLTCEPFKMCLLRDVIKNAEIINNIVDDMNTLDWSRKKMDIYEFHQTTDLANLTWQRGIRGIYDLLKDDLMPWVSRISGLTLTHVSASCSLYGPGDHLLVHDDLLNDRRVAFILYLAPWRPKDVTGGWSESMGGTLELFESDERGQPTRAVKSVVPQNNALVFFPVSPLSFHQVTEVVSLEYPRLSINGWFHGPVDPAPAEPAEPEPPAACAPHGEVALLSAWMTSQYLAPRTRLQIQQQMEKASEISLQNFLAPDKYQAVLGALSDPETQWEMAGPANLRRYELLRMDWIEDLDKLHPLREFVKLFTSNSMYRFLHDCTDLTIQSHFRAELQRWRAHCYQVLPPKPFYCQNQLDLVLYLGLPDRLAGGVVTYVAPEEEADPLVSLEPSNNALNLVYADSETASFTKHTSAMTLGPSDVFYILTCSYKEQLP